MHLRLFDSSLYYALASASESTASSSGAAATERAFNASGYGGGLDAGVAVAPTLGAVNLTYFTPAISHVMLAPATTTATTPSAAATMVQTTAAPSHDLEAAGGVNSSSSHQGELDNLNSFYFYEVGARKSDNITLISL